MAQCWLHRDVDAKAARRRAVSLTFADADGHRVTAFITDTPAGVVPGQLAGLDLRHRQHARVEDRIRQAKATGLRNLPCHYYTSNSAWLEIVMTATDLVAWCKLIGFADQPALARCEIAAFRYRVLHVAAIVYVRRIAGPGLDLPWPELAHRRYRRSADRCRARDAADTRRQQRGVPRERRAPARSRSRRR